MCLPAVPVVLGAASSIIQGVAESRNARAQASAAEQNARFANYQADDAIRRGGEEGYALRRRLSIMQGQQRGGAAAAGIDPDSGSMMDIRVSSIREGERDVSTINANHAREAWGYNVQAGNFRHQAAMSRHNARGAMTAGLIGAGGSLLSLARPGSSGRGTLRA